MTAATRVHGRDHLHPGGESDVHIGPGDANSARFQRLPKRIEHRPLELRQLVEEQHPQVRQADLSRPDLEPAADQRRHRGAMVRRAERPPPDHAAAVQLAEGVNAKGIVVITRRGLMADLVANCRPFSTNIYAFTNMSQPRRTMMLNRGVFPFKIDFSSDPEKTLQTAFRILKEREQFQVGDKVVIISDVLAQQRVDSIQIRDVPSDDVSPDTSSATDAVSTPIG